MLVSGAVVAATTVSVSFSSAAVSFWLKAATIAVAIASFLGTGFEIGFAVVRLN